MKTSSKQRDARGNEWTTTSSGPHPMRHSVEAIGPEEAKVLLSKLMPDYREPNPRYVEMFANLMRRGHWKESSEPLMEDDELGLVGGRMRLLAVIESGCTVNFHVMRGKFDLFEPPEEN
jgi:hypothetical protein